MPMRSAVANEAGIDRRVNRAARKLAPDVVRIRYALTSNSTGQDSIFFRVMLSDDASRENRLQEVTERIEAELLKAISFDEFGLYQYFDYRSRAEQAALREQAWS